MWLQRAKKKKIKKIAITIIVISLEAHLSHWISEGACARVRYYCATTAVNDATITLPETWSKNPKYTIYYTRNMVIVCISIIIYFVSRLPVSPHRICIHRRYNIRERNEPIHQSNSWCTPACNLPDYSLDVRCRGTSIIHVLQ